MSLSPSARSCATHIQSETMTSAEPPSSAILPASVVASSVVSMSMSAALSRPMKASAKPAKTAVTPRAAPVLMTSRAPPHQHAARGIIGDDRRGEKDDRAADDDREREGLDLAIEGEADELDRVGERIELADRREPRAPLLNAPQGIEGRGGEEHREDDEIHDPGEILELPDERREHHAERAQHQARQHERGQDRHIAPPCGWLNFPEIGDDEIGVDLQNRDRDSGEQLRGQKEPARGGADQEHAHRAHLAIVDHRQRGLHAVEQLDHRYKAGGDVNIVQHISVVGRNDRDAERLPEARGEDEEPDERPDERGHEPLALMQKAQALAPHDALQADHVGAESERPGGSRRPARAHVSSSSAPPVSFANASPIDCTPAASITERAVSEARTRPLCNTTTL